MVDYNRYRYVSPAPSRQLLRQMRAALIDNLAEMSRVVDSLKNRGSILQEGDRQTLLFVGSILYDYYLLVEDSLLIIARTLDKWIPASLDWHRRLLHLMALPIPDSRPPVLSEDTAMLLEEYLTLFVNYHSHCSKLRPERAAKMIDNLETLHYRLERELNHLVTLFNF